MQASSSRRSVVKGIGLGAAAAAGAGLGALYWTRSRGASAASPASPHFVIVRGTDAVCREPAAEARQRELQVAAWLSFATLVPSGRERLLTALESLLDSIEARLHPLGMDLLDESPEQVARREAPWLLPIWTTARSIARRCFVAGDRSLAVVVQSSGAPPSPFASFDPFGSEDTARELRLARFLCWPISSAIRVRLSPPTERALRERCGAPRSTFALVIDRALQSVDLSLIAPDLRRRMHALRERLSRLARPKCDGCESFADVIDALTGGLPDAPVLDWLELGSGEALAVPRLSAVSQPGACLGELRELGISVVVGNH
ncbi:MAG TPA: hypothetical protein VFU02_01595 [Polyangiaceae bacterium]|nr:hypothetical protein [Polyangiaceae bacterium]